MNAIGKCERLLAETFGRRHCILTGRGASALWIAYSMSPPSRSKVLLPAMVCLSPMFTVGYADRRPIFADVLESDATIDPTVVEDMLAADPQIGAVVAVHLYGHPAHMERLSRICRRFGAVLIEDLAQALGGTGEDGNLFGTTGDIAVLSFGHSKILDLGGGGALLTDNDDYAFRAKTMAAALPPKASNYTVLGQIYRQLYYPIWEATKRDASFSCLFDDFPSLFHPLYLLCALPEEAEKIQSAMEGLDDVVRQRRERAEIYTAGLKGMPQLSFFKLTGRGVPWRYTFMVKPDLRARLLESLRQGGMDASEWYPEITQWTPSGRKQGQNRFPVARRLTQEVVNLWVSPDYTADRIQRVIDIIRTVAVGSK